MCKDTLIKALIFSVSSLPHKIKTLIGSTSGMLPGKPFKAQNLLFPTLMI